MKKILAFLLCLLMLASVFAGCGSKSNSNDTTEQKPETTTAAPTTTQAPPEPLSAAEVAARCREAMNGVKSMRAPVEYAAKLTITAQGMNVSLNMDGSYDMEYTKEPAITHIKGEMSAMGQKITMDAYTAEEAGKTVVYQWDEEQGSYLRSETQKQQSAMDFSSLFSDEIEWSLEEGDTEYVLSGELDTEKISSTIDFGENGLSSLFGDSGDAELSALVPVSARVEKETMYLRAVSMDLSGLIKETMSKVYEAMGGEIEVDGTMAMNISYTDYNADITITLPEHYVDDPSQPIRTEVRELDDFSDEELAQVHPMLFRVTGENGQSMYLFGTIHVGDGRNEYALELVKPYLDESDALAVEFDTKAFTNDFAAQMAAAKTFLYTDGSTAADHMPVELYERCSELLSEAGVSPEMARTYKLGMWTSLVDQAVLQTRCSLSADYGIDSLLIDYCYGKDLEVRDVESAEFQYGLLAGFSDELCILQLEYTLDNLDSAAASTDRLYEAWCGGDYEEVLAVAFGDEISEEDYTAEQLALLEDYENQMIFDRNKGMKDRAVEWLTAGDHVFFAVGAAHLVGEGGLVELLRAAGYTVEQLDYAG